MMLPYESQIPAAIKSCPVFVILLSKNTKNSIGSQTELKIASKLGKPIISVKLEWIYLPFDIDFTLLKSTKSIDLYDDYQYNMMLLRQLIKSRLAADDSSLSRLPPESLDVCISCAAEDQAQADRIIEKLEQNGLTGWRTPKNGEFFSDTNYITRTAAERCCVLLALISKNYGLSYQDHRELGSAIHHRDPVIIAFLEDTPLPEHHESILSLCQNYHLYPDFESSADWLITAIRDHLNRMAPHSPYSSKRVLLTQDLSPAEKRVFISYSSKELRKVEKYVEILEQNSIPCWIAPRDIPYGADHAEVIPNAIEQARCMLVFLSKKSQDSAEIAKEVRLANDSHIPIIPVRLDSSQLRGAYKYHLINKQWFFSKRATPEDIQKLMDDIHNL